MSGIFISSSTQYTSLMPIQNADGTIDLDCYAHGTLTALTPYAVVLNEYGWITSALPAAGVYIYVGVPRTAITSGDRFRIQIGGYIASMVTPSLSVSVGHGLTINTGAVADIGADFSGAAGEFACNVTATSSATAHNVILIPNRIITI